jgi:hypothetical protein
MIVPLELTIYFSTLHYNLLDPESGLFVGLENFRYFLTDPAFLASLKNTLVGSVLALTILIGSPLGGRSIFCCATMRPFRKPLWFCETPRAFRCHRLCRSSRTRTKRRRRRLLARLRFAETV